MALRIPIDPVALTEALPFLVCTIGFDKPLRLARAVFTHPHLLTSPAPGAQMKPAPKLITESLTKVYSPIIRDYFLEIAVLVVGAYSKVGGLKEVCALAAILLGVDCILLCTYLAAILGIMIDVSFYLHSLVSFPESFLCSFIFFVKRQLSYHTRLQRVVSGVHFEGDCVPDSVMYGALSIRRSVYRVRAW
jgi:hypothetical protein